MNVRGKWYKTKKNIGFTSDGKDLSDLVIVVGDKMNYLFPDWFLVNDPNTITEISMPVSEKTLEFTSRVIGSHGPDYQINPDECVSGYVVKYGMSYIFQLDELEECPESIRERDCIPHPRYWK